MKHLLPPLLLALLLLTAACDPVAIGPDGRPLYAAQGAARPNPIIPAAWTPSPLRPGHLDLLAMGDWGARSREQKAVAATLADYAQKAAVPFAGLLSVGDNFYTTFKHEEDSDFKALFEDMYDARRLNFPFYVLLGNHDYEKYKDRFQLAYALNHPDSRWKLPSRWYRLDLPAGQPIATILMLDSNKSQLKTEQWYEQLAWLEAQLKAPRQAPWMIVCAHHTMFSNGSHGDSGVLQTHWGPLFKQYGVDFYLCGHDHDLQHLQIPEWQTSFLVVGGGGRKPTKMRRDSRGPFSRSLNGFAHLHFTAGQATVTCINGIDGKPVHQFARTPASAPLGGGKVNITLAGGNDKAAASLLNSLLGEEKATDD